MPYVTRDTDGFINGTFAVPQFSGQEWVNDTATEVYAFNEGFGGTRLKTLRDELAQDPLDLGYAQMSGPEMQASLASKIYPGLVELWRVQLWAIEGGLIPLIYANINNSDLNVAGACITIREYLNSPHMSNIDFQRSSSQTLIGVLKAGNIITEEQENELLAMAANQNSRCDVLGIPVPSQVAISAARAST